MAVRPPSAVQRPRDAGIEPMAIGRRVEAMLLAWLGMTVFAAICFTFREQWPWVVKFPPSLTMPFDAWLNVMMDWFIDHFRWLFLALSRLLAWPMIWLRDFLVWLPWTVTIGAVAIISFRAQGWRLAVFSSAALFYMALTGYWEESMNTLALVGVSVPLAILVGFAMGVLAFRYPLAERCINPILDFMQTIPAFAYLIPILMLFGFGPVVGMIAAMIYAAPPMTRNLVLGLRRVPVETVEAGLMSGGKPRQLFWQVQIPIALPSILVGINQTMMAALNMVIIAAIIGSFADIGWEVLSAMRKAQFGQSLLAGLVIALLAMTMDRISRAYATGSSGIHAGAVRRSGRRAPVAFVAVVLLGLYVLKHFFPALQEYPDAWVIYPAEPLNRGVEYIIGTYPDVIDSVKKGVAYYFMLPLRIGLEGTIKPYTWGFELTPLLKSAYGICFFVLATAAWRYVGWRSAVAIVWFGGVLFFGVTKIPWPVFLASVTLLAWQLGGWRVAVLSTAGLTLMLLAGVWQKAMLSIYLCGAAVIVAFIAGSLLGILAARSDVTSAIIRPINDALQTMPLFVFLIPVVMFFQVGEFAAFIAIVFYAIVPAIRYTEHGIRNVPTETVEAAEAMGSTKLQRLLNVELPMAFPEIMLGLNQTIMFALAMLVIAALVGTKGLGQSIYVALSQADFGSGIVAGISISIIAIIADRNIQAWSRSRRKALGLESHGAAA